jgi:hypothetical protein
MNDSRGSRHRREASTWRPALFLTLIFRVVYSVLAATFGLYLPVDWQLIHSNALTENLLPPDHSAHYLLLTIWERFDTLWYLHVARYGYDRPDAVVFYPLYPYLIRIASLLVPPAAAALLISTLAAFFVFWGLQNLLLDDVSPDLVKRTLILCVVWPASFIFFAAYPESLLLALILWSLYLARKDRWIAAAMLAIAAEMTKAVGAIVMLPLLIMAARRRTARAWPLLLTPLGALAFPLWVRWSRHDTVSSAYQHYWHTTNAAPWTTLGLAAQSLMHRHDAILILNLTFLIAFCVFVGLSRARLEYKLYAVAAIVLFLCKQTTPPLQSMMRYLIIVFPAFVGVAQLLESPRWQPRFWLVSTGLFIINAAWMWLFLGWSLIL